VGVAVMVGVDVDVGVSVTVGVNEGVRLGGANCVGVAGSVIVGGPGVNEGSIVRIPGVVPGRPWLVTVGNRVGVAAGPWLGPRHVSARIPAQ